MVGEPLPLNGCTPTPLASYLKALGVLRLISSPANHVSGEAADPHARGWWQNECFHLRTTLSHDALLRFFLYDYAPSPIIAPWNGGSGFYPKDNKDGLRPARRKPGSEALRAHFVGHPNRISHNRRSGLDRAARRDQEDRTRGSAQELNLSDGALAWLDAALALSGDGLAYPQLLGTGGNRRSA